MASLVIQEELRERTATLGHTPSLAVISVATHPSIASFIKIKRKFGEAVGVTVCLYDFSESSSEEALIQEIQTILTSNTHDGIIIQLPLPPSYTKEKILNLIPKELDVDVLGEKAWESFTKTGTPLPPVVGAIAQIFADTQTDIHNKNIVVIGQGKLVGLPISVWLNHQGISPTIVDIDTPQETSLSLYKNADIVISGIGLPHHLKPEHFKQGVILIDAGTSEQAGVLAGDCDPLCSEVASIFTPVPGGVGPLTVAFLFKNLIEKIGVKGIVPPS